MKKELVDRKVSGRSGLIRKKGAVCVLLLIFLLTACGGVSKSSKGSYESAEEPEYAARSVLMSTLFFALSLPAIIWIGGQFFG